MLWECVWVPRHEWAVGSRGDRGICGHQYRKSKRYSTCACRAIDTPDFVIELLTRVIAEDDLGKVFVLANATVVFSFINARS